MAHLAILGAGYVGAAVADRALARGDDVTLGDDWSTTRRDQLAPLAARGARVLDCDIRDRAAVDAAVAGADRVLLLAAQTSRPRSFRDPETTETTNLVGPRHVAEAVAAGPCAPLLFASSLHVYGPDATGAVGPEHPYGRQGDLAHLSKVYAELLLRMHAERVGFPVALMRLAIVFGPGPVEHDDADHVTVVDKFRRLAAAGRPLTLDDGGRATIGVVHLADAARILLEWEPAGGVEAHNVCAEAVTVADVAALAEDRAPAGAATRSYPSPFRYEHGLAAYLRP